MAAPHFRGRKEDICVEIYLPHGSAAGLTRIVPSAGCSLVTVRAESLPSLLQHLLAHRPAKESNPPRKSGALSQGWLRFAGVGDGRLNGQRTAGVVPAEKRTAGALAFTGFQPAHAPLAHPEIEHARQRAGFNLQLATQSLNIYRSVPVLHGGEYGVKHLRIPIVVQSERRALPPPRPAQTDR